MWPGSAKRRRASHGTSSGSTSCFRGCASAAHRWVVLAPLIVAEVGRTIRLLKEEGQSIVLVEQNLKLALDVADQAVILNTGRCVFSGSAGELLENEELIAQNLGVFHAH